jgi:D-xylose transport system ATP-binding protein
METEQEQRPREENGEPVLEIRDLTKRFGATLALNSVSLTLGRNEVLALLGDNGAGKSTLIKCLSGVHEPDEGQILIDGKEVHIHSPMQARSLGVETVYQDLALFDNLDVVGNFYAGRELMSRLEINLPGADVETGLMSGGQRQAVASARAMAFGRKIVILDEPTSALGARESRNVLRLIQDAPGHGVSVIVISHNLEHIMQVADRAVVLRQGNVVGEAEPNQENHERLVSMIVGGADEPAGDEEPTEEPDEDGGKSDE